MFDQGYYYGIMDRDGLNVHNCSGKQDIMLKNITKRPREFDNHLVTEYTEYISACKGVCYIGAIKIDQGAYNARYNTLYHIFVPSVSNIGDPYDYVRYVLPCYYDCSRSLDEPLGKKDIPEIDRVRYDYAGLLKYCRLNAASDTRKFAKLLELAYGVMFNKKAAVVLPDEMFETDGKPVPPTLEEQPENCYQLAAALILLLHQLVPDCFDSFNSRARLRITLMHSIARNTLYKNGFCFISRKDARKSGNVDCPVFDWECSYEDYPRDSFYYALAEKAQQSLDSMNVFLGKLCKMRGVEKFPCRRQENVRHLALNDLLNTYKGYIPRRKIERDTDNRILMSWESYQKLVAQYEEKPENVFYREYIDNLAECGGRNQIPGDAVLLGFWKQLETENFRDAEAVVFLLGEYKSEDTFFSLLNDVIDREDILSELIKDENAVLAKMIKNISKNENGMDCLGTIAGFFGKVNHTGECFGKIISDIFGSAKILYQNFQSEEDRRKWLAVMNQSGLFDEKSLKDFVGGSIAVSDDISAVNAEKSRLDPQKDYDVIKGKKMFSECLRKCRRLFETDKSENNIKNKETVKLWKTVCSELEADFADEQSAGEFNAFCREENRFYREYTIVSGNSRKEMGDFPQEDDGLRELYIERLSVIVHNFTDLEANSTNPENLKDIFDWNRDFGQTCSGYPKYELFRESMKKVYEHFVQAVCRGKNYIYLSFADKTDDSILKTMLWDCIVPADFIGMSGSGFTTKETCHAKACLFGFYWEFNQDISSKITAFSIKFAGYGSLQTDVLHFMELDEVKQLCRTEKTAMKNYYYLSGISGKTGIHRVIYDNFGGNIPPCDSVADSRETKKTESVAERVKAVFDNTQKYQYMKLLAGDSVQVSLIYKNIDMSLLDSDEKTKLYEIIKRHIEQEYQNYENNVFGADMKLGLENLNNYSSGLEVWASAVGSAVLEELKKESGARLFNGFMGKLYNAENLDDDTKALCIREADKLAVDEEKKKQFRDYAVYVENDIKEQFHSCEKKISAGDTDGGLKEWSAVSKKIEVFRSVADVDALKKESDIRLFDWFIDELENNEKLDENTQERYMDVAENCSADPQRKAHLKKIRDDYEKRRKENKKIDDCNTLSEIKNSLEKKKITFSRRAFEKTAKLLENQNISFSEYRTGIFILHTFGQEDENVQNYYIKEQSRKMEQTAEKNMREGNFSAFWLLYADLKQNTEFLREFWKKTVRCTQEHFANLYQSSPFNYSEMKKYTDIIADGKACNDITANLFFVYVLFRGYSIKSIDMKEMLRKQKQEIETKCGTSDSIQKNNNIDGLRQALNIILEECADNIAPREYQNGPGTDDFLFMSFFELSDIIGCRQSGYFHIEIVEKLKSSADFLEMLAWNSAYGILNEKYKYLGVLKFALEYVLVKWYIWYIEKNAVTASYEMEVIREHIFDAYDSEYIIPPEVKMTLKEHWQALIRKEEKKQLSDDKRGVIEKIKRHIGMNVPEVSDKNENAYAVPGVKQSVQGTSAEDGLTGAAKVHNIGKQYGIHVVPVTGEKR